MNDFETSEQQDAQHLKAFNNGYLIAQHEPELAKHLMNAPNPNNDYYAALVAGSKQFELDKQMSIDKSHDIEKPHRKNIEPEI